MLFDLAVGGDTWSWASLNVNIYMRLLIMTWCVWGWKMRCYSPYH